jgi:hypothetical protein
VGRLLCCDDGDDVSVLGIETTEKVKHLTCLVDGLADVAECVGELLEPAGVLSHVHVSLDEVAELGLQVDSAVELVVAELVLDGDPDGVGSWHGDADDGEDVFGDGVVQPTEQVLVDDAPIGITTLSGGWGEVRWSPSPNFPTKTSKKVRHSV